MLSLWLPVNWKVVFFYNNNKKIKCLLPATQKLSISLPAKQVSQQFYSEIFQQQRGNGRGGSGTRQWIPSACLPHKPQQHCRRFQLLQLAAWPHVSVPITHQPDDRVHPTGISICNLPHAIYFTLSHGALLLYRWSLSLTSVSLLVCSRRLRGL